MNVNNLLDQRSELLKKTAGLIDIQYVEETGGAVNVFTADGRALVQGNSSWQLAVRDNGAGFYDVVYADNPTVPINDAIGGGKLSGMLGMRDTTVAGYLAELDDLARTLINAVNAQHAFGYDNYRNVGGSFFEPLGVHGGPGHAGGRTPSWTIRIESPPRRPSVPTATTPGRSAASRTRPS